MTSTKPLVSIIITSYNYAQYIGQTIRSVLDQTYDHWELIISDDASSDNSLEVIRSFTDKRITVLTAEMNEGAGAAYNKAYLRCVGKYFISLDSDDYLAPDKIEKQVKYLEEHDGIDILGTFVAEVDLNGQPITDKPEHEAWFNQSLNLSQLDHWIWKNHLAHSSVLLRKLIHDRVGQFDNDLIYTPDYEFWVRCFVSGAAFHVLPEPLTYYRSHGVNITHKDPNRSLLEYAYIFCAYWKPYLELNRPDLIHKSITDFLIHHEPYQAVGTTLKANLLKKFLSGQTTPKDFKLFMANIQEPPSSEAQNLSEICDSLLEALQDSNKVYQQQQTWINELEQGKAWLEAQWRSWEGVAAERQRLVEEQQHLVEEQQRLVEEQQCLLEKQQTQIEQLETTLNHIYQTRVWKFARKYWAFKEKILNMSRQKKYD